MMIIYMYKMWVEKNEKFSIHNLIVKRPGNGMPSKYLFKVLGKKSNKKYLADQLIKIKV